MQLANTYHVIARAMFFARSNLLYDEACHIQKEIAAPPKNKSGGSQ
jgi:hypothetical protein